MTIFEQVFVLFFGLGALIMTFFSFYHSTLKRSSYTEIRPLVIYGIFVWGDGLIFAPFWFMVSTACLYLNDFIMFLLIVSVFWVIRSLGETIYWFNQQFSTVGRCPPEKMTGYWLVKNDSIWFIYQIFWQCVAVVSVISAIYFAQQWIKTI